MPPRGDDHPKDEKFTVLSELNVKMGLLRIDLNETEYLLEASKIKDIKEIINEIYEDVESFVLALGLAKYSFKHIHIIILITSPITVNAI